MTCTAATKPNALSAAFVSTVKKPGKYHDGKGTGLFLLVKPTGARFWVQRITIRGKRRELGLGSPPVVKLADAREQALENKRMVRVGGDPLRVKREAKSILTFEEAAHQVHELHRPTWRNAKHAAQFISTLETYAFPKIGRQRVVDVTTADVLRVLSPIWTEKPETARRVRQRIGAIMKWSIAQGWRQDNPAEAIAQALPKHEKTKNHRKSLPYYDVADCVESVKASGAGQTTKLALEFLILTAARSAETRLARWDEFEFGSRPTAPQDTWTIPSERMKAKKVHRVPLSGRALEILKEAQKLSDGSGLVFPGTRRGRPLSDMTLSKLVKKLGFDADVHGFRTSFKTWAQEQTNFANEISEIALAHTITNKAEAAYARSDLFEKRRKMMESWAGYLTVRRGEMVILK